MNRNRMRLSYLWFVVLMLTTCQAFADEIKVVKDVVYHVVKREPGAVDKSGKALNPELKLKMDVYTPNGFSGKRPGVVILHGGGWFMGDKADKTYVEVGTTLAEKGFVAFAVNYRLVPEFHYPAAVDDVQRAVRWIRCHAKDYELDPERIGAFGDSAGGHLSALLGTRDTRDNSDPDLKQFSSRVQCVVDLFGPVDFNAPAETTKFPGISVSLVKNFFNKTRDEAPELYKEGSPVTYVDKKSAPFLIMHGENDPLVPVDQSKRLESCLKTCGVEVTFVFMPKDGHGFRLPENKEKQKSAMVEFFTRLLKP